MLLSVSILGWFGVTDSPVCNSVAIAVVVVFIVTSAPVDHREVYCCARRDVFGRLVSCGATQSVVSFLRCLWSYGPHPWTVPLIHCGAPHPPTVPLIHCCTLPQIRLTLAKKDFVRALIQSRKINRKVLLDEDMQDIKVGP